MKENIYAINDRVRLLIKRSLIIASFLLTSFILPAQQPVAHEIRNLNANNNNNNPNINGKMVTSLKTLSTLSTVTPRENVSNVGRLNNAPAGYSATTERNVPANPGGNIYYDSLNNSGNLLLNNTPAKLSSFTGNSENGEYRLTWETVVENDVKQYNVEYSINNIDFQGAGTVDATNRNVYTFNYTADAHTVIYYRLKVIDTRGGVSYTNPIVVRSTLAKPVDLVTPTIIRDGVLNITLANSYKNVQLFNNAGVEVFREYLGGRTGNRIGFNLPTLPAGPYFVKLTGTNSSVTQRVMIM
jgi:hypothetical protein